MDKFGHKIHQKNSKMSKNSELYKKCEVYQFHFKLERELREVTDQKQFLVNEFRMKKCDFVCFGCHNKRKGYCIHERQRYFTRSQSDLAYRTRFIWTTKTQTYMWTLFYNMGYCLSDIMTRQSNEFDAADVYFRKVFTRYNPPCFVNLRLSLAPEVTSSDVQIFLQYYSRLLAFMDKVLLLFRDWTGYRDVRERLERLRDRVRNAIL